MNVTVRQQKRKTLAFKLTPQGPVALIPQDLDPEGEQVQRFVARALARLPSPEPVSEPLGPRQVHDLVAAWSNRLGVQVARTQIRAMRNKWGSISTAGTLTLADDVLELPPDLAEYIIVHELLHLKLPDHHKGWQVSMGVYLPDWRAREERLQGFVVQRARTNEG